MNIYLMRHFEVDFEWEKKYTSEGFKAACNKYDNANIINQTVEFNSQNINVYISELIRSDLTYKALKLDARVNKTALINEVPIAPFIKTTFKLLTPIWMTMGRIQWFLNIKKQPEIRRDTQKKIELLINQLVVENNDILIIGHGFYFSQLKKVLKKKKYTGNGKSRYKNGEIVKFNKVNANKRYH
jgi:broad specificity phosphatase PhoE